MFGSKEARNYAKVFWPEGPIKKRNMKNIRKYYDLYSKGNYGEIDDQTFLDLTLESLYTKLDKCYSTAGQSILYNCLRVPKRENIELNRRNEFIEFYREANNESKRLDIQEIMFNLGTDKNGDFLELINNTYSENNFKKIMYFFLGRVMMVLLLIISILVTPYALIALIVMGAINAIISNFERNPDFLGKNDNENKNSAKPFGGIAYSARIISSAVQISKLNVPQLEYYKIQIDMALENIGKNQKKLVLIGNLLGNSDNVGLKQGFFEAFCGMTLHMENAYYSMIGEVQKNKNGLKLLYSLLGEIDALVAVAGYKEETAYEFTKPIFVDDTDSFEIKQGAHPLIKDVVKNSIEMDKKGIVLTGTNMSGKSTFLRMLGINIVLAQSFDFVHAEKYKAPFLNLITSISPEDDITSGKSYYLAEAESMLRIINSLDGEFKVFCAIDEIFRGTNPVERIAASEEILKYIQKRNTVSIVATHDKELTDLLEATHSFYHFSERVSESEGLSFDYKLKEGKLKTRNAIKLLKYIGYPKEIVDGAYENIDKNNL
ncbi:MAG: MutS-related protein [Sarcina sp.]